MQSSECCLYYVGKYRYRYKTEMRKEDKANIRALVERQRHRLVCFCILFFRCCCSVFCWCKQIQVMFVLPNADYTRYIEGNRKEQKSWGKGGWSNVNWYPLIDGLNLSVTYLLVLNLVCLYCVACSCHNIVGFLMF